MCAIVVAHAQDDSALVDPESANVECADCAKAAALIPSQIEEMKMEVFQIVNQERQNAGLPPLCLNKELGSAAQDHSDDQQSCGRMSHTGCDGSAFTSRMTAAGYEWTTGGENVAWNQKTAAAVMSAWMNSSGHRANILGSSFKNIGIGLSSEYYWTQDFGSPASGDGCNDDGSGGSGGSSPAPTLMPTPVLTAVPPPTPTPPPPVNDGEYEGQCTWKLQKPDTFCNGQWGIHRKILGQRLTWTQCAAAVDADADCGEYAYGAVDTGAVGSCRCVLKGQLCEEVPSTLGNSVYRRECPRDDEDKDKDPCSGVAKSVKLLVRAKAELQDLTDEIARFKTQLADHV